MIIVILDYNVGEVIIKTVPKEYEELDGDDIIINMGYNSMSSIDYMIVDNDLDVNIDTKGCSSKLTLK